MPNIHIDPLKEDSQRFNAMEGDTNSVIEATVVVLQSLFGNQEEFFKTVQELSTSYITKLLKILYGDEMDIMDVLATLRNERKLVLEVEKLKARDPSSDVVEFFEAELLGTMKEKYRQFVIKVMTGQSDTDLDKHFAEGGVLSVNTAMGEMGKSGDAFGQFLMMHLQNATMRRPGTEKTRTPHYLIVDEYSLYMNLSVKRFLAVAAGYRVASIIATQSLGDLEVESGDVSAKAMKQAVMTNCRNKIAFGGQGSDDAKEFQEEFGMERVTDHQGTFHNKMFSPKVMPQSYKEGEKDEYRFNFDYIMFGMPRFHFIYKLVDQGVQQQPGEAKGIFVPRDWRQRRKWKKKPLRDQVKRTLKKKGKKWMEGNGEAELNEKSTQAATGQLSLEGGDHTHKDTKLEAEERQDESEEWGQDDSGNVSNGPEPDSEADDFW